jgi:hypothetical protein
LGVLSGEDVLRCHGSIYFVKKKEENFSRKISEDDAARRAAESIAMLTFVLFNRHLVVFSATSPYQGD